MLDSERVNILTYFLKILSKLLLFHCEVLSFATSGIEQSVYTGASRTSKQNSAHVDRVSKSLAKRLSGWFPIYAHPRGSSRTNGTTAKCSNLKRYNDSIRITIRQCARPGKKISQDT